MVESLRAELIDDERDTAGIDHYLVKPGEFEQIQILLGAK